MTMGTNASRITGVEASSPLIQLAERTVRGSVPGAAPHVDDARLRPAACPVTMGPELWNEAGKVLVDALHADAAHRKAVATGACILFIPALIIGCEPLNDSPIAR